MKKIKLSIGGLLLVTFSIPIEYIYTSFGMNYPWIYGKNNDEYFLIMKRGLITDGLYSWLKEINLLEENISFVEQINLISKCINFLYRENTINTVQDLENYKQLLIQKDLEKTADPTSSEEIDFLLGDDIYDSKNESVQNTAFIFEVFRSPDTPEILSFNDIRTPLDTQENGKPFYIYSYSNITPSYLKRTGFLITEKTMISRDFFYTFNSSTSFEHQFDFYHSAKGDETTTITKE